MNTKELISLGVPLGASQRRATDFISKLILGGGDKTRLREEVAAIVRNPAAFTDDPLRGDFARALLAAPTPMRAEPAKYRRSEEHTSELQSRQYLVCRLL